MTSTKNVNLSSFLTDPNFSPFQGDYTTTSTPSNYDLSSPSPPPPPPSLNHHDQSTHTISSPGFNIQPNDLSMNFTFAQQPYHKFNGIQSITITITKLPHNQDIFDVHMNHEAHVSKMVMAAAEGKLGVTTPEEVLATGASGPSKSRRRILKAKLAARKDQLAKASGRLRDSNSRESNTGATSDSRVDKPRTRGQNLDQQWEVIDQIKENSWSPVKRSLFVMAGRTMVEKLGLDYVLCHFSGLVTPNSGNCQELERQLWMDDLTEERVIAAKKKTKSWVSSVYYYESYLEKNLEAEAMKAFQGEKTQGKAVDPEDEGDEEYKPDPGEQPDWSRFERKFAFTEWCLLHRKVIVMQRLLRWWPFTTKRFDCPDPYGIEMVLAYQNDTDEEEDRFEEEEEEDVLLEENEEEVSEPEGSLEESGRVTDSLRDCWSPFASRFRGLLTWY